MDVTEFTQRIEPFRERILRQTQSLVADESVAEDLTQECLIRLWQQRDRLAEVVRIEAFISTMARHLAIDYLRTSHRWETLPQEEVQISDPDALPERSMERRDLGAQIEAAISRLPSLQQSIFRLKEQEEMENEEIAQITGIAVEAVYNHLSRARKSLRTLLLQTYEDHKK